MTQADISDIRSDKRGFDVDRAGVSAGFRRIYRHDRIFQTGVYDTYKTDGKPLDETYCPLCGAVFTNGCWRWNDLAPRSYWQACPACHRINDSCPAGFITLYGEYFHQHRDEIMRHMRLHERHELTEHPLKRIMALEETNGATLVSTTDIHLAHDLGEALLHDFRGELQLHYNRVLNQLRVSWTR